jgi:hypothetical protein
MNKENVEDNTEKLYRKGFGTALNTELEEQIKSGKPEFFLEYATKAGDDDMAYRLHYKRDADPEKDKVYLNTMDAMLVKNTDAPGEVREQSFPADWLITAAEAHRMLKHGELVAVNKTLFNKKGEQYNTWISIDVKGKKDEYGNYPVNSYHENYYKKQPFVLKDELQKLAVPVKEVEAGKYLDTIEKSLKKANLVNVTIMHNGEQSPGFLAINPKVGRIDVYDKNMQLIEKQQQAQQQNEPVQQNNAPAQQPEDEKKKSWPDQKVNWEKKDQSKGISR